MSFTWTSLMKAERVRQMWQCVPSTVSTYMLTHYTTATKAAALAVLN